MAARNGSARDETLHHDGTFAARSAAVSSLVIWQSPRELGHAAIGPDAEAGRKLKVIVTGGHPGDPEYGCGGTIARYTDLGSRGRSSST